MERAIKEGRRAVFRKGNLIIDGIEISIEVQEAFCNIYEIIDSLCLQDHQ
jgi:hypothetical protein